MNGKPDSAWTRIPEDAMQKPQTPEGRHPSTNVRLKCPFIPHANHDCVHTMCQWWDWGINNCIGVSAARAVTRIADALEAER